MPIVWDVSKVKNFEQLTTAKDAQGQDIWHPVTEALVWHSLGCGFNRITEKNAKDVWLRIRAWEKVKGTMLYETPLTEQNIIDHIGMETNASTKTLTKFAKDLIKER